jgi:hypothetical protein
MQVQQYTDTSWFVRLVRVHFFSVSFVPVYLLHILTSPEGGDLWVRSGSVSLDPKNLPQV